MLDDLDDSALDELPYGVVCLNESMTVVRMNRTESEKSGIQRWRAIGRAFFGDVAPGPTNRTLAEHIRAFATARGPRPPRSTIAHTFKRYRGEDPTTIELVRGRSTDRLYLCIHRE